MRWGRVQIGDKIYMIPHPSDDGLEREIIDGVLGKKNKSGLEDKSLASEVVTKLIDRFIEVLREETSLHFYGCIVHLYEDSSEVKKALEKEENPVEIDGFDELPQPFRDYFPQYRTILRWVLSESVEIELDSSSPIDPSYGKRLGKLISIGLWILQFVIHFSEMRIWPKHVGNLKGDGECYSFNRNPALDHFIDKYQATSEISYEKDASGPIGETGKDIISTIEECFGFDYWKSFNEFSRKLDVMNHFQQLYSISKSATALNPRDHKFFSAFVLHPQNKASLFEIATKPQKLNRFLFRPILEWNIEGNQFYIMSTNSYVEAVEELFMNVIPYNDPDKIPPELQKSKLFKHYAQDRKDSHESWQTDQVKQILEEKGFDFIGSTKKLVWADGSLNLETECGEVDSLILNRERRTIYVCECKNLKSRPTFSTQQEDYDKFFKSQNFQHKLNNKVSFLSGQKPAITRHFSFKNSDQDYSEIVDYKVEGLFILNSRTSAMYHSCFRGITTKQLGPFLDGTLDDPVWDFMQGEGRVLSEDYRKK